MTYLNLLLVVVAVQQALDVWTTKVALATGRAKEANGPLNRLMEKIGIIPALLCTKLAFGTLVVLTAEPTVVWYVVLGAIIALYTWVLFNNIRVLKKIGAL